MGILPEQRPPFYLTCKVVDADKEVCDEVQEMVEAYAECLRAQAGPVQCTCKRKECCQEDGGVAGPEDEAVDGQGGLVIGNRYSVKRKERLLCQRLRRVASALAEDYGLCPTKSR